MSIEAELAIRAAKAEIERDAAIERAKRAEEIAFAWSSGDTEKMLDTIHILGIPARDLRDIYRMEADWRKAGGTAARLDELRELTTLRARFAETHNGDPH